MARSYHGKPIWYELTTSKGKLEAAERFYGAVFGWIIEDSGMDGFDYHLANAGEDRVAGLMSMPGDPADLSPFWMIYFAVDDADAFLVDAGKAGGRVHQPVHDIPGTGRFAILADPQGAVFGILEPDMSTMSDEDIARADAGSGAFDPGQPGHGTWNELISTDPVAAFAFYSSLFGWTRGDAIAMGDRGSYQLFRHSGADIGGMMALGEAAEPNWLPYFGVNGSVCAAIAAIKTAGGRSHHGAQEVPGGSYVAAAQDPQGAWFAVAGTQK